MMSPIKLAPLTMVASLMLLGGCAALPQSGPAGHRIIRDSRNGSFILHEVDSESALPSPPEMAQFSPLPPSPRPGATVLAAGDAISVVYYEVGARLFSSSTGLQTTPDANARATTVGPIAIDRDGLVRLPYTGEMHAAGLTPQQLAFAIEQKLRTISEHPQIIVRLDAANGSSVMVSGEITRTGRVALSGAQEKLLDVISLAGGPRGAPETLLARVDRHGLVSEGPLEKLTYENFGGTVMEPGDRVQLVRLPWSYSVLGSANRASRYDLPLRRVSLVEALAQAGGPNEYVANPAAVFVFRFVSEPATGGGAPGPERAVVYHINMKVPKSYLLAQRFWLQDKDVVYVGGAETNQPSKLLQIIGQVFSPIAVARQATY
ncbi:polysaccharide export outer membrane protein [Novosphingobium sp. SG751A]|uniref:polysaccharide biosynthesis/export family protein n=1 Tax=Novosphingobium sp. SG751A TaxID=2587000 RepID=UPI00155682D7|nr:polysaccharide biosynthesis/export family protein [Novosphingobium sp. SG751A]NOW48388.1 polysaccharide export outer membrane protein [Novosphingobium sp. SG751A]